MEFWLMIALLLANLLLLVWLVLRKPAEVSGNGNAELLAGMAAGSERLERELRREISDNARHSRQELGVTFATFQQTLVAGYSNPRPPAEQLFICTGGGPGIMEAANRGAQEMGALTLGLNIVLPHEQSSNPYISPSLNFKFHYFALRKMHFMMRAKALVAFPGGFGTLDELFEVITLVQTRKAKPVPIILFGSDYWKRLCNFDVMIEEGAISPQDLQLFQYVDDPQDAWDAIKSFYEL